MGRKAAVTLGTLAAAGGIGTAIFLLARRAEADEEDVEEQRKKAQKAQQQAARMRAEAVQARQEAQSAHAQAEAAAAREARARRQAAIAAQAKTRARQEAQAAKAEGAAAAVQELERRIKEAAAAERRAEKMAKIEEQIQKKAQKAAQEKKKKESAAAKKAAEKEVEREAAQARAEEAPLRLEAKRQAVQQAFLNLVDVIQQRKGVARQRAMNEAAAFLKRKGISLAKPDPDVPFWQLSMQKIQQKLADSINLYMTRSRKKGEKGGTTAPKPKVTTEVPAAKLQPVREAYEKAIIDTIAAAETQGKTLTVANAAVPVMQSFSRFDIPSPQELDAASPFWANPASTIRKKAEEALNYHRLQVNIQTGYKPPGWEPKQLQPASA